MPTRQRWQATSRRDWQLWLTVPVTHTYTLAVFADDGFNFSGIGPSLTNTTTRALTTTEASSGVVLTPGLIYNFSLAYMNYTTATTSTIELLWRRAGGALEIVPREAIHARGRRDYYSFAGAPVAMKEGVMGSVTRTLSYLHGDHLGSASLTTNASGQKVSEQRYKPYGEVRWSAGAGMPTDKQFTSQTRLAEGYVGTLYDYVARAYDPVLGRFISPDTIVPGAGNGQAFNRYSYVSGNPLGKIDPSGHMETVESDGSGCFGLDFNLCYSNAYRDLGFGAATSSYVEATAWTFAAERLEIKAHVDPDNAPIVEAAIGTRERASQLMHIADMTSRKSVYIRPREYADKKAGGETQAYAILSLVIDLATAWLGAEMDNPTLSRPSENSKGDVVRWGDPLWGLDEHYLVKTLDTYTTGAGMFGDVKANEPGAFAIRAVGYYLPVAAIVIDVRDILNAFFEVYEQ